jgi:phosphotransferase system  glucose/maltose/N-acetylglucosamine-specific IIC component
MSTTRSRGTRALFLAGSALAACLAAWFAYRITSPTLGTFGGILSAVVAALLVGAPLYVAAAVIWAPAAPPKPRRAPDEAVEAGRRSR